MIELLQRWSLVIVAAGASLSRQGSQSGTAWLTALGIAVVFVGGFFFIYKRAYNLGWIAAIVGGSLFMLGIGQNSSLFGNPIETPNLPMIVWGIVLAISGIGFWAFMRFVRKTQTS